MADLPSNYARLSYQSWHSHFHDAVAPHTKNATPFECTEYRKNAIAQCFLITGDTLAGIRCVVKCENDRQFQNAYAVDGSARIYVKICNREKERVAAAWETARVSNARVKVLFPVFMTVGSRPESEKVCDMRVSSWTPKGVFLEPFSPPPEAEAANKKKRASDIRSYFGLASKKPTL